MLQPIRRASHNAATAIQHVSVNHRCGDVRMTEEFLYRPNVIPILEQVSRE